MKYTTIVKDFETQWNVLLTREKNMTEKPPTSTVVKYRNPEKRRFVLIRITVIVFDPTHFRKI